MLVPSVATTPLQLLTNRATVRDDLNRTATATAGVNADLPAPPNAVSSVWSSLTSMLATVASANMMTFPYFLLWASTHQLA
jgi:hypothetical protein